MKLPYLGLLIIAGIFTACSSHSVRTPKADVDKWNRAAQNGNCRELQAMLHPGSYDASARQSFYETCRSYDDNRRADILRANTQTRENVVARLEEEPVGRAGLSLRATNDGWLIHSFEGTHQVAATPYALIEQLYAAADSQAVANLVGVLSNNMKRQYLGELNAIQRALEYGGEGNITIRGTHATLTLDQVTIQMARNAAGQWELTKIE